MESSQLQHFQDRYWSDHDQERVWRHGTALKLVRTGPVLDLGGGDGFFLDLLRKEKGIQDLHLLDISPVAVEKAQQRGIQSLTGDITRPLPYSDGQFGTVCALDTLEHLYEPIPVLKEMARIGQEIVIIVPNFSYWRDRVRVLFGKVPFHCKPRRGHVFWFNLPVVRSVLKEAGLQIDEMAVGGMTRYGQAGQLLANFFPSLFAHSFALRLRRTRG